MIKHIDPKEKSQRALRKFSLIILIFTVILTVVSFAMPTKVIHNESLACTVITQKDEDTGLTETGFQRESAEFTVPKDNTMVKIKLIAPADNSWAWVHVDVIQDITGKDGRDRQHDERHGDHGWGFMQVFTGMLVHTLLAVEHQEVHTEAVERGNKDTNQYRPVGKIRTSNVRGMYRLDNGVFGVESGKERGTDEGQRTNQ